MFVRKSTKESTPILHRLVVEKHGSHNQSSHGRKGGGGSGGSGGGGSSAPSGANSPEADKARSTTAKTLQSDMDEALINMDDLSGRTNSAGDDKTIDNAMKQIIGAQNDFKDATKLKGKAQTAKMQSGVGKIFGATDKLSTIDDKRGDNIASSILDDVQATFGDSDSAFTELGLDVDDLFGP